MSGAWGGRQVEGGCSSRSWYPRAQALVWISLSARTAVFLLPHGGLPIFM